MTRKRKIFIPEFKLESAQLVIDLGYTLRSACEAAGVGKSIVEYPVREDRQGDTPRAKAMTPGQRRIQEMEKQLRRVEEEKEILKKATALLMSDSLNNLR